MEQAGRREAETGSSAMDGMGISRTKLRPQEQEGHLQIICLQPHAVLGSKV